MPQKHIIILPDEISDELELLTVERKTTRHEVVARAVRLYAAAYRGRQEGLAVGLADPNTLQLTKEFVGL